jgi:pimeloyl-ACP methyl ester carboxylesterase
MSGCATLAAEIVITPASGLAGSPPVVFCFPGGGMTRQYFDLAVPGYSFAEFAAARGFAVVLVDHAGVGDSDVPDDPWLLTPQLVADLNAAAVAWTLDALSAGAIAGLPALSPAFTVAVAHSAGALVLIHHQSVHRQFDGIALLGWGGHGLPEHLEASERTLAADPQTLLPRIIEGAGKRHSQPLPVLPRGSSSYLIANPMPPSVHGALTAARTRLLAVVGYASIIPGSASQAAAAIDVPVFLGVGEKDIAVRHHEIPAEFTGSNDVTLFVLTGAGHNHNVEPNRARLWERVLTWTSGLSAASGSPLAASPAG